MTKGHGAPVARSRVLPLSVVILTLVVASFVSVVIWNVGAHYKHRAKKSSQHAAVTQGASNTVPSRHETDILGKVGKVEARLDDMRRGHLQGDAPPLSDSSQAGVVSRGAETAADDPLILLHTPHEVVAGDVPAGPHAIKPLKPNGALTGTKKPLTLEKPPTTVPRKAIIKANSAPEHTAVDHNDDETAYMKHLHVSLFSTLKPCAEDGVFDAQLAAVSSWAALPLPVPTRIFLIDTEAVPPNGSETCSQIIAKLVPNVEVVRSADVVSDHGTVLLGPALKFVSARDPDAEVLGLINGDILLHPRSASAIAAAYRTFKQFFLIGRRTTVDLRDEGLRRKVLASVVNARQQVRRGDVVLPQADDLDPLRSADWFKDPEFAHGTGDRMDAEDYFLFSRDYFAALRYEVPSFHIGRPAFDNWLVHTAIHTLQPVVDASGAIPAYHLRHDYAHLKGDSASATAGDADKAAESWSYWGSKDQKTNYDLGLAHGGWRHDMFDFAPLHFVRPVDRERLAEAEDTQLGLPQSLRVHGNPALHAAVCSKLQYGNDCFGVTVKAGWKPLANDDHSVDTDAVVLASLPKLFDKFTSHVRPPSRTLWRHLADASGNPYMRSS
jgi:hypothetical protein